MKPTRITTSFEESFQNWYLSVLNTFRFQNWSTLVLDHSQPLFYFTLALLWKWSKAWYILLGLFCFPIWDMSIRIWSKLVDVWQNAIHSIGGMGLSPVEDLATSQEGLVPHSTHWFVFVTTLDPNTDFILVDWWSTFMILSFVSNRLGSTHLGEVQSKKIRYIWHT